MYYTTPYQAIANMTRDELVKALNALYSYDIEEFEGLTMTEIWEILNDEMQATIADHLAGSVRVAA